jgi:hypothetical protein
MAEYTALIERLCAKRSRLALTLAANPKQITDEASVAPMSSLARLKQCAVTAAEPVAAARFSLP